MSARLQRYLLREDAARVLGVTVRALESWASKGTGPAYRRHGKRVVYGELDLAEWSDQQARTSTSVARVGGTATAQGDSVGTGAAASMVPPTLPTNPTSASHRPSSRASSQELPPTVAALAVGGDASEVA